ncbi:MAG: hypothetical protein Q4F05_05855 [bacterium]|nr:hypothetical protein [bacterium]
MNKKAFRKSLNLVSVTMIISFCIAVIGIIKTPEDIDAFNVTDRISNTDDYIEAYQTTNSNEIEAYVTDVHFVDER